MTLLELLQTKRDSDMRPMHMPGHKRNTALAPYLETLGAGLDITEIEDFGNLYESEGVLADRMADAARLWGSKRAWWLVGGSTAGLLAAVDASTNRGDKVLLARNCHKSVYNACMLCGLDTVYVQPKTFYGLPYSTRIEPEQIENAFLANPDIRLVVITSPTYEGIISDIGAISEIVHRHGAILLVDEAHGAHLGLHHSFPASAITLGADIVVHSLHKTLPCLTQTGMLHLCSDRVSREELAFRLSVYQTSSPSYLLMASIDGCIRLLREQGDRLFAEWTNAIDTFYLGLTTKYITAQNGGTAFADPSKIILTTTGTNFTGPQLAKLLKEEYKFEAEMSTAETVLCMTGMGDTVYDLLYLAKALNEIDETVTPTPAFAVSAPPLPGAEMPMHKAVKQPAETISLADAVGRTAADFLWAYPPGVPLIVPGERIEQYIVDYIRTSAEKGVTFASPKNSSAGCISVLKTKECFSESN